MPKERINYRIDITEDCEIKGGHLVDYPCEIRKGDRIFYKQHFMVVDSVYHCIEHRVICLTCIGVMTKEEIGIGVSNG